VAVIGAEEIETAPISSVGELLSHVAGVDVRQRGTHGTQADISIRGGTFEQTLVLIDGIKVSDPQTGHHNLDLPVALNDIARIEVLNGPGSRSYGPNAMAGAVNIITKKAAGKWARVETSGGSFGLNEQQLSLSYPLGTTVQRLSFARRSSTGYRDNTEYDIKTLTYRTDISTGLGPVSLSGRYQDKEFGAHKFYSDAFPDEWEATETSFLTAAADLTVGKTLLSPKIFWRRHEDSFVLDRERPDFYNNVHRTDHYGAEFQVSVPTSLGILAFGGELASLDIDSVFSAGNTDLGNHSRTRAGLFAEQRLTPIERLSIVPGLSVYAYEEWGWNAWPGLDAGYQLTERLRLFGSLGKSFRVPTHTELYTSSPANMGDQNLAPGKAWTYELGAGWKNEYLSADLSGFLREGHNMIDWVRESGTITWYAVNTTWTMRGAEAGVTIRPVRICECWPVERVRIQYTYLDTDYDPGAYDSKYALQHLTHQATLGIDHRWFGPLRQSWKVRYLKRFRDDDYMVTDTRLTITHGKAKAYVEATNLFDQSYVEIGTIPMPGRWLRAGLSVEIGTE
jgi:iron complex outermembrane receptor protein